MEWFGYLTLIVATVVLSTFGALGLYLMLYGWWSPQRSVHDTGLRRDPDPKLRFTVLLPARHEEKVIAQTIRRVWESDYPKKLLEVRIICEESDIETIAEAERAIAEIRNPNIQVIAFKGGPINKPHGLNVGLSRTTHEIVTIFDAEDDVDPLIFHLINATMLSKRAPIVQAGVQLMDIHSSWFAVHNILEYFFWFRSRLAFHARVGMVPLGGNTVFIERRLIEAVGGWDERCLTEDADIGIRLSVLGEPIVVTYDARHVTREETPPTVLAFIRQRSRWNQGFIQILRKGDWRRLPSTPQRWLAVYTLIYPLVQAAMVLLWPISIAAVLLVKAPVFLALLSFLPLYAFGFQLAINLAGLLEFASVYRLKPGWFVLASLVLGYLPYQVVLTVSALRAAYRETFGKDNWEKTAHSGAHRTLSDYQVR